MNDWLAEKFTVALKAPPHEPLVVIPDGDFGEFERGLRLGIAYCRANPRIEAEALDFMRIRLPVSSARDQGFASALQVNAEKRRQAFREQHRKTLAAKEQRRMIA